MVAMRGGIVLGVTEAGGGVANLITANGQRSAHLQRWTIGKHSRLDLNGPELRLTVLSAVLCRRQLMLPVLCVRS